MSKVSTAESIAEKIHEIIRELDLRVAHEWICQNCQASYATYIPQCFKCNPDFEYHISIGMEERLKWQNKSQKKHVGGVVKK